MANTLYDKEKGIFPEGQSCYTTMMLCNVFRHPEIKDKIPEGTPVAVTYRNKELRPSDIVRARYLASKPIKRMTLDNNVLCIAL